MGQSAIEQALGSMANLTHGVAVVPSNTVDLTTPSRALLVGTAGAVKLTTTGGDTVTTYLTAGWHPIAATRIFATGTAATDISAWW